MTSTRRLALLLAAAVVATASCSLGLRESEVRGQGGGATTRGSTGGGSSPGSSSTRGPFCGDGTCDHATEDCSTCPGDCPCFQGLGCSAGKCLDCKHTFAVDVAAPDARATSGLVAVNDKLYLAPTLQHDGGTKAALAEVDGCFGTVTTTDVTAPSAAPAIGGPVAPGGTGAAFVAACGFAPSSMNLGAGLVVGGNDGPHAAWQLSNDPSSGNDMLAGIATAGDVWMADGLRDASPPSWFLYGDLAGKNVCSLLDVFSTAAGAAMASSGDELYAAGTDENGISLAVFQSSECHPASCTCKPKHRFAPFVVGAEMNVVGAMLFASNALYISGFASDDGSTYYAFVAMASPTNGALGTVYRSAATTTLSAYVSLATDGSLLYAGGYAGATAIGDVSAAKGVVAVFQIGQLTAPTFSIQPMDAHAVVGLATATSQPGFFFAQVDKSPGASVYRCKSAKTACP